MQLPTGLDVAEGNALELYNLTVSHSNSLLNMCVWVCRCTWRHTHNYSSIILLPRVEIRAGWAGGRPHHYTIMNWQM